MTIFQDHVDLGVSLVAVAPSPGTSGLSFEVTPGEGVILPTPPFDVTFAPPDAVATFFNSEVAIVDSVVGDVCTLSTRAAYGTTARDVLVGDRAVATITANHMRTVEQAIAALENASGTGDWIDYTPIWHQGADLEPTIGVARYTQVGKTVTAQFRMSATVAGDANTQYIFSLPVPAANTEPALGFVSVSDMGSLASGLNSTGVAFGITGTIAIILASPIQGGPMGVAGSAFDVFPGTTLRGFLSYEAATDIGGIGGGAAFGPWTDYAPTWTQGVDLLPDVGIARYIQVGTTVTAVFGLGVNAAGTPGEPWLISLPVPARASLSGVLLGSGVYIDGPLRFQQAVASTTLMNAYDIDSVEVGSVSTAAPGDYVTGLLTYEAATGSGGGGGGVGAWTPYTPTWTSTDGAPGPSLGDGTLTGLYRTVGDGIDYEITLTVGTTTNFGADGGGPPPIFYLFSLPVAVADVQRHVGNYVMARAADPGHFYDWGTFHAWSDATNGFGISVDTTYLNASSSGILVIGSGDFLVFTGSYRPA